jgi:hypothetical protein
VWVLGWAGALALRFAIEREGLIAWVTWVLLLFFTLAVFAVLVRLAIRWIRAGSFKQFLGWGLVLLIVLFFAQRLISPGDTREISNVLETVATSEDPSYCTQDVTEAYLEQMTGAKAPFADELCEIDAEYEAADSVDVYGIEIDGDRATATVERHGGGLDGSTLVEELIKEDGDWKANRLVGFAEFDRQRFDAALRESFLEFGSPTSAAECAVRNASRLSDAQLQRIIVNGVIEAFDRITATCDRAGVERSMIQGFAALEYQDVPPQAVACAEAKIKSLSDVELARLYTDLVAYGSLQYECDSQVVLDTVERQLSEEGDLDDETVDCVLDRFRGHPPGDLIRVTYDEDSYRALVEDCES